MHATKENCREANRLVNEVLAETSTMPDDRTTFIAGFFDAAIKRLPSQASIDKDKQRGKAEKKPEEATPAEKVKRARKLMK